MSKLALAVHGGAGTIRPENMTPELEREYRQGLQNALESGWKVLKAGGTSLDAVEAAVVSLEDFHLFNAGRGSVFTHEGTNEMDACVMDGHRLKAGAIAAVRNVRNPIKLARLVMDRTEHILLATEGANRFATEMQVEMADDEYFFTDHRYQQLLEARDQGVVTLDHDLPVAEPVKSLGTVGAVACDQNGHLAAATSTGGMTNKKFGRVGDTPLIGLGTYADDQCAVSCTGHGEYFMLGVTAFDIAARMRYKRLPLNAAAEETITRLTEIGGEGGLVGVDTHGNIATLFNSDGMYRGVVSGDGELSVEIYR